MLPVVRVKKKVYRNNDVILITARIWHKYYSTFSTQILLEAFDTHITARIRHRYYSKYSTQILQQEFVTNIIASFRHKYYSKYSTQILQKVKKYVGIVTWSTHKPWPICWNKRLLSTFSLRVKDLSIHFICNMRCNL
jgi:hypothetical protein